MDMKKILQAMDGVASKPAEGSNDMKKFLRVVYESNLNQKEAVGDFSADPAQQAKRYLQFHSGLYDPSTLPPTMSITPSLSLAVQSPTNFKGSHEEILANMSAANKRLPKEFQVSWDELKQLGGVSDTIALTGEPHPDKYNPATDPTNANPAATPFKVKEGDLNQPVNPQDNKFKSPNENFATITQEPDGTFTITYKTPSLAKSGTAADGQIDPPLTRIPTYQKAVDYIKQDLDQEFSLATMPPSIKVHETESLERFLSIVNESKGPLNRLTAAESIAMNQYTQPATRTSITSPVLNVAKDAKPSMVGKYFKQVEEEFAESKTRYKDRARQLAERVIERIVPGEEPAPGINRLTGKPNVPDAMTPEPAAPAAVQPLSSRYGPGYEGSPEAYTITVKGQNYKFAGREKQGPGTGPIIKVPGGAVGIRGLAPVNVELGTAGEFYIAPKTESVSEAPIAMDPAEPNNPTIHGHEKANAMTLKGRIMSARAQLKELAELADSNDLAAWERITQLHKGGMFMGLAQNLEQIRHGIEELAAKRKKGGVASRGIDPNIGEAGVDPDAKFDYNAWSKSGKKPRNPGKYDKALAQQTRDAEAKKKQQDVAEDNPCWDSHKMVGTKKKGGKTVPNCVPK